MLAFVVVIRNVYRQTIREWVISEQLCFDIGTYTNLKFVKNAVVKAPQTA